MIGIIGRSGAGKSTLLRMINRLTDATSGQILFEGRDVTALKGAQKRAWKAQCAMIFQQFNLVPRIDVVSNVLHGTPKESQARALGIRTRLQISSVVDAIIFRRTGVASRYQ